MLFFSTIKVCHLKLSGLPEGCPDSKICIMNEINTYAEAYDYLFQFLDFSLTHQEQISPERFELERMFRLMELLGNPQEQYPAIHIAGTKGKGSVAAHCDAALRAAGLRTGLYTSPHLSDFRERIRVDGEMIPESAFVYGMRVLQQVIPKLPGVTSYELQTALAFWYFAQAGVECAVVEVGMGGRLDSTNILTPLVSVITNISFDHTAILGDTLAAIAGEKGGIIKQDVPVVSAPQQPEALSVLRVIASEKHAPLTVVGEDLKFIPRSLDLDGQQFEINFNGEMVQFTTRLLGPHQVENAAVAFSALRAVQQSGLAVTDEAIRNGFATVVWPGRFEVIAGSSLVVFDGAHNRHSTRRLVETVNQHFEGLPLVTIFGASEDKDIQGMFEELLPRTSHLVLYQANHPRAAKVAALAQMAKGYHCPVSVISSAEKVFKTAFRLAGEQGLVLVTGSLYLVGDLRQHLV